MSVPWSCREQVVGYLQRRPDKAWELRRSGTEENAGSYFRGLRHLLEEGACGRRPPQLPDPRFRLPQCPPSRRLPARQRSPGLPSEAGHRVSQIRPTLSLGPKRGIRLAGLTEGRNCRQPRKLPMNTVDRGRRRTRRNSRASTSRRRTLSTRRDPIPRSMC